MPFQSIRTRNPSSRQAREDVGHGHSMWGFRIFWSSALMPTVSAKNSRTIESLRYSVNMRTYDAPDFIE